MVNVERIAGPQPDEYFEYYGQYIDLVQERNVLQLLEDQVDDIGEQLGSLAPDQANCLHAPYTWTIKQVIGHMIDCERIFGTRVLRIAVGDQTPIPGIDQDIYVANLDYARVSLSELIEEFSLTRQSNLCLIRRLSCEALDRRGTASGQQISARANVFILAGHVIYHLAIIQKRLNL